MSGQSKWSLDFLKLERHHKSCKEILCLASLSFRRGNEGEAGLQIYGNGHKRKTASTKMKRLFLRKKKLLAPF